MPWLEEYDAPSRYVLPRPLSDDVVLGREYLIALAIPIRKLAAREKDMAAELGKDHCKEQSNIFKAYDYVIKYFEGNPEYTNWRTPRANSHLAPYIDQCFWSMENEVI